MTEEKGPIFSGDNYQNIKKVVSIWINTKVAIEKKGSIKRYNYVESEHRGNYYKDERSHYDLVELIVLNLGEEDTLKELGPLNELFVRKNPVEEKYFNLKEKYGIELCEGTKGEVHSMCNLGECLVEESRLEGKESTLIENIRLLMKNLNKDYDFVASLLELDITEKIKYQNLFFH